MSNSQDSLIEKLNETHTEIKKNSFRYNCLLFCSLTFLYGFGFISGYLYHGFYSCDGSIS